MIPEYVKTVQTCPKCVISQPKSDNVLPPEIDYCKKHKAEAAKTIDWVWGLR